MNFYDNSCFFLCSVQSPLMGQLPQEQDGHPEPPLPLAIARIAIAKTATTAVSMIQDARFI